jgi:hypothetical protein
MNSKNTFKKLVESIWLKLLSCDKKLPQEAAASI